MARLIVTRPQPQADALAEQLRGLGHIPLLAPLSAYAPLVFTPPQQAFDAVLFTSAAAPRFGPGPDQIPGASVFAVGEATAQAARGAGFADVTSAQGDGQALADLVAARYPKPARFLHPRGAELGFDMAAALTAQGHEVAAPIVYQMVWERDLPEPVRAAITSGAANGVLLLSPRAAQHFLALSKSLPIGALTAYCMSPRIAQICADAQFGHVTVASRPEIASVLDLLVDG
ncbi:MAG: uroporphyrinogen-III synthase [Neomegalonema sp.]|nr:uroporphyrinogen-III synthase [Neomegalonema sp.]